MDIKELNKTQLVLLTLLITFVVSVATGIVTVSLMEKVPKSVPQTINNVIQRTIEKVTTTTVPEVVSPSSSSSKDESTLFNNENAVVSIYPNDDTKPIDPAAPVITAPTTDPTKTPVLTKEPKELGQGIIISDVGLILVDTNILTEGTDVYNVMLNKIAFNATILKKFSNGFTILKITPKAPVAPSSKPDNTVRN